MRNIRLVVHNVRSLWNTGSFFRTSDAFQVEKIYLTGYTPCPPRLAISKTAIGAQETVQWVHADDPLPILQKLQKEGFQIVALELGATSIPLQEFKPSDRVCLVVGHELSGIPKEILSMADATVEIPMLGSKESLNVAVAAGIALHHLRFA